MADDDVRSIAGAFDKSIEKLADRFDKSFDGLSSSIAELGKSMNPSPKSNDSPGVSRSPNVGGTRGSTGKNITQQRYKLLKQEEASIISKIEANEESTRQVRSLTEQRNQLTQEIESSKDLEIVLKSALASRKSELAEIEESMESRKDLNRYLESQSRIAKSELSIAASGLEDLNTKDKLQKDELSQIESRLQELGKVNPKHDGRRGGRARQRDKVAKRDEEIFGLKEKKASILAENEAISSRISEITQHKEMLEQQINAMQSELDSNEKLTAEQIAAKNKIIEENKSIVAQIGQEIVDRNKLSTQLNTTESQLEQVGKSAEELAKEESELTAQLEKTRQQMRTELWRDTKKHLKTLNKDLENLVKAIRGTQQQFGISAGQAARLRFDNLVQSVSSTVESIRSIGKSVPVTAEQIRTAQQDFQAQFGGIIDSVSARGLAEQAVEMGVTTRQLAEARRIFATQTMGDIGAAIEQQDKFISQFEARGMTAKDAMEFIGSNSELLARSGTRFQRSLSQAAADAKRIGVDLSKVNQVGDNIIGNFEGFLDSMAELGAMGFGFDGFRLAQVAETGDTGALFNELRSQLAMTGKDLTQLRRSEQLALSSAFGMNIEEFQRMAGILEEPVEEKLQKEANGFLSTIADKVGELVEKFGTQITNLADGITQGFKGLAAAAQLAALRTIAINTSRFLRLTPGVGKAATGAAAKAGTALGPAAKIAKGARLAKGGGILAGVMGAGLGFMQAKKEGKDLQEASGAAGVRGGAAAGGSVLGATLGSLIAPGVGTVIGGVVGGFLGDKLGEVLNKRAPGIAANMGAFFAGIVEPFKGVLEIFKGTIDPLKDSFKTLFSVFSLGGDAGEISEFAKKAMPIMKELGSIIGNVLVYGLRGVLVPLRLFIGALTVGINIISLIAASFDAFFTGDWTKAGEIWKKVLDGIWSTVVDSAKLIFGPLLGIFKSIGAAIMEGLSNIPGPVGRFFRNRLPTDADGDDVISRPGYGERTLVTPTANIALNNDDNVVAYADDMIARNTGIELLSKGAIVGGATTNVDMGALERKIDQLIVAVKQIPSGMNNIEVKMDSMKVGEIIANSEGRARVDGVFRSQRL
jgi:hypothetical protein